MAAYDRLLRLGQTNSFFLFGARGTGKSTLLKELFARCDQILWIDLLRRDLEDRYAREPELLYQEIKERRGAVDWVVIDEIQKLPKLLDTVHRCLESDEFSPPRFALTGSSARKLKHGGANLLAGRAFVRHLHPLISSELGPDFELEDILNHGALPGRFAFVCDEDRHDFLSAYALTYLNEEVWAEHLVRKLDPFRRFLEVAAQSNGKVVNFRKTAADVGADEKTVKRYYQILEDTLVGVLLEAHHTSRRKRLVKAPKFYFFDLGVVRALARTLRQRIVPGTYAYGSAFEHFYIMEVLRRNDYGKADFRLTWMQTESGVEVDLVLERPGRPHALIEVKSGTRCDEEDAKALRNLRTTFDSSECFVVSNDPVDREQDGVHYLHWSTSFAALGLKH
jgi:predicted AAA+ superfamily ATPase